MSSIIALKLENKSVRIEEGELVGFSVEGHEYIHQKGSPGWSSSDTEMFPIIGPVNESGFKVKTPRGIAVQDQHGHLRQMEYKLVSNNHTKAVFRKSYKAGTQIKNSKFPKKSTAEWMDWPYSFEFEKSYNLTTLGLEMEFVISGDKGMPFMLGYHPAFKLYTSEPIIETGTTKISLGEVLAVGSRALQVTDCESITLKDEKEIAIKTEGFGHFMCWTEVTNMVCIEPISFYPYAVAQENLHAGFQLLDDKAKFKVLLAPKG
ncbi:aldose 1-epimerase [uncultured Croceitalea sp.]|uniref:aldose epimerase family protein n=1 Tax=uncultured Croceitalea sp. TaxID=1798908 RepID=UPI003305D15F